VTIPESGSKTISFSATVYNEYDQELEEASITYSLVQATTGVSINSTTGVVTVTDAASPGTVQILAECGSINATAALYLHLATSQLIPLSVTTNNTYYVSVTADGVSSFLGQTYTLTYDPNVLEIADLSALTWEKELTAGVIPGTGITIISVSGGEIVFSVSHTIPGGNILSGVINTFIFKAISSGDTTISIS